MTASYIEVSMKIWIHALYATHAGIRSLEMIQATQQKELEPLRVPKLPVLHQADVQQQADLQAAIFLSETGLTLEEAMGQVEAEIPVAPILTPFEHGKPFVTGEEEKCLGT